jgi:tetratricopeptide (TPR) repeat protein
LRPVSTKYTDRLGKRTELVCAQCLDRFEVQESLEWGVHDRLELAAQERYDEILAWLDTFAESNRHRDHDGWMARSVASARAHFLWEAERYVEALEACHIREKLGFENVTDHWALGLAQARNFEGLERHDEALAVFEETFRHQDPRYMSGARYFLRPLIEFSENAGKPVDESWREVVQNVADEYEVEMPVRDSLGETILALFEMTENKPSKRQREQR